jgi:hypothetical protein
MSNFAVGRLSFQRDASPKERNAIRERFLSKTVGSKKAQPPGQSGDEVPSLARGRQRFLVHHHELC